MIVDNNVPEMFNLYTQTSTIKQYNHTALSLIIIIGDHHKLEVPIGEVEGRIPGLPFFT